MHCSRLDWNEYLDWHWDTLKLRESQYDRVKKTPLLLLLLLHCFSRVRLCVTP